MAAAPRHWPRDILQITISFTYNNDVNIYAPDQVISYARDIQYIFLAQNICRIALIIGLQQG